MRRSEAASSTHVLQDPADGQKLQRDADQIDDAIERLATLDAAATSPHGVLLANEENLDLVLRVENMNMAEASAL